MPTIEIPTGSATTTIAYDDLGAGGPPLVFVHGWGGNRTNFAPQLAAFAPRHRVVAIDRPGHGESPAAGRTWSMEAAADGLAVVCRELGLAPAVFVQHSYDRLAYTFAARHPELLAGLVVLDGPTLAGPGFDAAIHEFRDALHSDHWREAIRGFAEQLVFPPGLPDAAKDALLAELLQTTREILVATWDMFVDAGDVADAIAAIRCPMLHVAGSFPSDQEALRRRCPQTETAQVPGAGHFIQLSAPDAVNELVAGFVARVSTAMEATARLRG